MLSDRIGVCLSGGGYRAAAFHLGMLDYLHSVSLLERVHALSTVSGGTIIGAAWALARSKDLPFEEFRDAFRRRLLDVDLVNETLRCFEKTRSDEVYRRRGPSLARAYADAYAGSFEFDVSLGELRSGSPGPLEIRFNTTEFDRAHGFRFSVTGFPNEVPSGSWFDVVNTSDTDRCRVADVVAASSCFPGAFEPLAFPDDFRKAGPFRMERCDPPPRGTGLAPPEKGVFLRALRGGPGEPALCELGLMDGGIYDNQGIDAMLEIERRGLVDTVLISDTDRRPEQAYRFPTPSEPKTSPLIRSLLRTDGSILEMRDQARKLSVIASLLLGLGTAGAATSLAITFLRSDLVPVSAIGATLSLGVLGLGFWAHRQADERVSAIAAARWEDIVVDNLGHEVSERLQDLARSLDLKEALHLARTRLRSGSAMVYDVFAARIRRLGYRQAFPTKTDTKSALARRPHQRISNLIYHLSSGSMHELLGPTAGPPDGVRLRQEFGEIAATARLAESYGTVLWFRDECDLDALISTGRTTCCINLLKHVLRRVQTEGWTEDNVDLWNRLATDWNAAVDRSRGTRKSEPSAMKGTVDGDVQRPTD